MAYNYLGDGGQSDVTKEAVANGTMMDPVAVVSSSSSVFPVFLVLAFVILALFAVFAVAKTIRTRNRGANSGFELSQELTRRS